MLFQEQQGPSLSCNLAFLSVWAAWGWCQVDNPSIYASCNLNVSYLLHHPSGAFAICCALSGKDLALLSSQQAR